MSSIHEDSVPRNAPRPSATVPETCIRPIVPEVSLIFNGNSSVPVNSGQNSQPATSGVELHPGAAPFIPQSQYRSSLPLKSYSVFRKSMTATTNSVICPQDPIRKQVRFDIITPETFAAPVPNQFPNYAQNSHHQFQQHSFKPEQQPTRPIVGGEHRQMSQNDDDSENCTAECCRHHPKDDTSRIFELVRRQGDQIRHVQNQVERLQLEVASLQKKHVRELEDVLRAVHNTFRPPAQADKSVQCCFEDICRRPSKYVSFGCQADLSVAVTDILVSSPINTNPATKKISYIYPANEVTPIEPHDKEVFPRCSGDRPCNFEAIYPLPKPTTDRSIAMYDLTMKYLPQEKLKRLENDSKNIPAVSPNDMSMASLRYLEKYGLIRQHGEEDNKPGLEGTKPCQAVAVAHIEGNKFLDVTAIRRQPKLL